MNFPTKVNLPDKNSLQPGSGSISPSKNGGRLLMRSPDICSRGIAGLESTS